MKHSLLLLAALFVVGLTQAQVTPSNPQGWSFASESTPGGSGMFVNGPGTPPAGSGSAEMTVTDGSQGYILGTQNWKNIRFADFVRLEYSTYQQTANGPQAIALQFNADYDLTDASTNWQGRLVFEPYHQPVPAVAPNVWQTWDALNGTWWMTGTPRVGNAVVPQQCPQSSPCTRAQLLAAYPDMGIQTGGLEAMLFKVGSGWPSFTGNVDQFVFDYNTPQGVSKNTIDFEAADAPMSTVVVRNEDMATSFVDVLADPTKWFFYNDENDTIDNSLGSFVNGPGTAPEGSGSAEITVSGTQRRNLATYQFSGTPLADITNLNFSTYNPSAGNGGGANRTAYINFNVDFDGSDTWQRRMIFLPKDNGTVMQDTWQSWDAIMGGTALWRYSGPTWPGTTIPGSTPRVWSEILASYPGVRVRVTDSWFGMRVGEPYASGYTENLDAFIFGTGSGVTTFDFEPGRSVDCTDPNTAPSYAGGYVLNNAQTRAFVKVMVPAGGTTFEFYNTSNLVVGMPEGDTESGTPLTGVTRVGDTFTFSPASPSEVFFPIMTAGQGSGVRFFLRVTDDCDRTVDVDPSFTLTGVAMSELAVFALEGAQPNPVAGQTTVRFSLETAGQVRLSVYDMMGREVARLVDGMLSEGAQTARLDASDLSSGLYMIRLEAGGRSLTRSLTITR